MNPLIKTWRFLLVMLVPIVAGASEERYEDLMNLRMEVESLNETWEAEKKRSKAEYERAIERFAKLKDETSNQAAALELVRARISGYEKREAETARASSLDSSRLRKAAESLKDELRAMLPFGRTASIQKLDSLLVGFENKPVDEIVEVLSKVLRDEVSKSRGVHLFRETHQVDGVSTPLEIARIGNVYAYVADANGRFGFWKKESNAPEWGISVAEEKKLKSIFENARLAKKNFAIEAGESESAILGSIK